MKRLRRVRPGKLNRTARRAVARELRRWHTDLETRMLYGPSFPPLPEPDFGLPECKPAYLFLRTR